MIIKHKAQAIRSKEWVYGYYVETKVPILGLDHYIIVNNQDACQIDINTLCVFTNVYDQIKNEVYEKDIIECEYYPNLPTTKNLKTLIWRGVVFYSTYTSGFHVRRRTGLDDEQVGYTYSIAFGGSAVKRWQVIGNGCSDPDLLKDNL